MYMCILHILHVFIELPAAPFMPKLKKNQHKKSPKQINKFLIFQKNGTFWLKY